MRISILKIFILCFSVMSFSLYAENEIRDNSTGVAFPSEVNFEYNGKQYHLQATGTATRKKFFVKVYSIASYLEKGSENMNPNVLQDIMQSNKAKQLTLKWVHEAGADKVRNGYQESFHKALSDAQYNQLINPIENFIQFFNQDVQKGAEHVLRWLPDGMVQVIINGNLVGRIQNQQFAQALWSIWFGENSVVNRDQLISLMNR